MIDALQIQQILVNREIDLPLSRIVEKLAGIDQQMLFSHTRENYSFEVWGETSPIGDIPLEHIGLPPGGKAFLIRNRGQLQIVQPFKPYEPGFMPMTGAEVQKAAEEMCTQMAWEEVYQEIVEMIAEGVKHIEH